MRVSYAPWGESLNEVIDAAVAAEAAGFTDAWISELHRSAFVPCGAIAAATSTIGVGTAIALAFVRSPMITALTALDLDDLSHGRFTLGLGAGVQRLNENWHNAAFGKPAPHLRETIAIIRRLIAEAHLGKPFAIEGEFERVSIRGYERPFPPLRDRIPIYVASVGEVMTRLAGEIADGWLGHELGSPRSVAELVLPNIQAGLQRAGRARGDIAVIPSAVCVIDADSRQAKRWAAGLVAFYATVRTYEAFLAFHGFSAEAHAIQERFRAGDEAGMIDATPDEMVDALTLAGTADEVRGRLSAYEGIADGIKLSPPTHLVPADVTRACQKAILEQLAP
ncbi:MAG: LLM class flavin-dependent oxidoreductase [Actinomycetota bacterium]|nr:LLM class flavin-dependent oxidoreductase [Actinomycetota bacterium]